MTEADTAILIREILTLLVFVHQNQVIHRDIKPSNLIRRESDRKIVLIDFGVVKQLTLSSIDDPLLLWVRRVMCLLSSYWAVLVLKVTSMRSG